MRKHIQRAKEHLKQHHRKYIIALIVAAIIIILLLIKPANVGFASWIRYVAK